MKPKLLVFDFDGTLADTKKSWFGATFKVFKKMGLYCPECQARLIIHFAKKIKEFLRFLEIPSGKSEDLVNQVYKHFLKQKPRLMKDFDIIKKLKISKIILSNTRTFAIKEILGKDQKYFDEIYGADRFIGKADLIKKITKKKKLKKTEVIYVGDMAGDAFLCKEAGCTSVIVSNRHSWNSLDEIKKESPDFIVKSLKDIRKIIK